MKNKRLLQLAMVFVLTVFVVGCQNEQASLTAPDEETAVVGTPTLVELPSDPDMAKYLHTESLISAQDGGEIVLSYRSFWTGLKVYMKVEFEPGSVTNDFTASLSTDTRYLTTDMALTFGPHGTDFLKPAKLTITASGLDLRKFWSLDKDHNGHVKLNMYYTSDGNYDPMDGSVDIDIWAGTLTVTAELPHFARYAFGL
jgi:hypothetical protein